jgi:hypothetical protein
MKWLASARTVVVVMAAACGGTIESPGAPQPVGSASVTGTVNGQPVPTNDAIATQLTTSTSGSVATSRSVAITSATNACPCAITKARSTVLLLTVGVQGTDIAPGTYAFPSAGTDTGVAEAQYLVDDPATSLLAATSGSITLSQISSSTTVGTFDVSFPTGERITGRFSAPTCAAAEGAEPACP